MLKIQSLKTQVENNDILKGIDLEIKAGEIHAIMGPNGAGKSSLLKALCGDENYEVTSGTIQYEKDFNSIDLLELEVEERAREGVFLGFQYPIEIPGITNRTFLHSSFNAICKHQGVDEMSTEEFEEFIVQKMKDLQFSNNMLDRYVNVDFSGGEKKRNEILQMILLQPNLILLDETDSGLDIDSMKIVADGINKLRSDDNAFVLVTHYHRLLNYVNPDFVHILANGRIIKSGTIELALEIEKKGYSWLLND